MNAGKLDRRIQFQRGTMIDNGLEMVGAWSAYGSPVWAGRKDVSDGERAAAGWIEATLASRFTVRSSTFTRSLTAKDRITTEGLSYDITGIKELGRRDFLEITAVARVDR